MNPIKLILTSLVCCQIFALTAVGKVTLVKGEATKLVPGALVASKVSTEDNVYSDTSFVTYDKSFIKIVFSDGTKMNIGPNSKAVIDVESFNSKDKTVISLLKGKLRTTVEKDERAKEASEGENKFYIKTRTAALGVRGTDFQTIYNPENQITNLLTFRGEVAMVNIKNNPEINNTHEDYSNIEREDNFKIKKVKNNISENEIASLDRALVAKDAVSVKAGQFSATTNEIGAVSIPVKINHTQLGLLFQNETLTTKEAKESMDVKSVSEINRFVDLPQESGTVIPEGIYDAEKGIYAPKAGGLIDLETALYVAPESDAKFDIERQVYIPMIAGNLEADTGAYVAPEGLKLNSKKGFVLASRKDLRNEELRNKVVNFNANLGKDVFISKKLDKNLKVEYYSLRELFTKDEIRFSLSSFQTKQYMKNSGNDRSYTFEGANEFNMSWLMAGNGSYRPVIGLNITRARYDNEENINNNATTLWGLNLGVQKYLTRRAYLNFGVDIRSQQILTKDDNNSINYFQLSPATLTTPYVGILYHFIKWQRLSFDASLNLKSNLYKDAGEFRVKNGFGEDFSLSANYWLKRNKRLILSFYSESLRANISGSGLDGDFESNKSGVRFVFAHVF